MLKATARQEFSKLLLGWYRPEDRPMPWKAESDPYRIWVSEVILHQTRVQQGWQPYLQFIQRFPTVDSLAAATPEQVLAQWQGLGYYRRAQHLHSGAKYIIEELQGQMPQTGQAWLKVKGIGPYSAAAIASFAYNEPLAVLDGNVIRVLARFFCLQEDPNRKRKIYVDLAQSLLAVDKPAIYNQAIMDLGATVCTPAKPQCPKCPFSKLCCSYKNQSQLQFPVKSKKVKIKEIHISYLIICDKEKILVKQRPENGIYRAMWDFPSIESSEVNDEKIIKNKFKEILPGIKNIHLLSTDKQQLTHRKLIIHYYYSEPIQNHIIPTTYTLMSINKFAQLAVPGFIKRILPSINSMQ